MKFLTFEKDGETSFGAVVEDGVVDLGKRHRGIPDLREAIRCYSSRDRRFGGLNPKAEDCSKS